MANNCGYRICINGDKEAAEELRNLLNSDEIGRVYSCSEFDETPNGFVADGSCNGSFYNGTDIWDANSAFRSAVEQLGLSIEVYGEEPSSFYEEHFVVSGNDLSVAEQTNAAYVISLDNMSPEEIAKEHGVSVDAVIGATDNDNVRFGGYEWEFNFESAHAERNDAVLHERFLRFLSDGCLNAGHGVFRIYNHEQLHDAGFTDAEFSEMSRFFSENDCPYKDTITLLSSPLLACRPEIIDQFKQFGHPYFNEPAKRVAINERSILDCGETEIAEETHVAENDVICEVIDSNIQDNGAMYIAQVVSQEDLPFTGYELLSGGDTIDSLIEKVADFHSGVDWSVAEHGGTALGISVLCHAHPSGYDTNDTLINFRQLSDMDADELSNMKDSFDEMPDNRKQELLSSLFNDPEHIQWMGRTAEHIESQCETAREAVKEELTAGIDDFKELSEKGTSVSDKEFERIFEGKDEAVRESNSLDSKRDEAQKAVDALSGKVADREAVGERAEVDAAARATASDPR